MSNSKKEKTAKEKQEEKKKSDVCRYLWFNEYYASQQNRLQRERLDVYLKHLNREKIQKLVTFHHEKMSILDERKQCATSTGHLRDNYESIFKSRNTSAVDTFIQNHSVGKSNPNFNRDELLEKFEKNVKSHKFKKKEKKPAKKTDILKKICSDDSENDDYDAVREIDDEETDDDMEKMAKKSEKFFNPRQSLSSNFKEKKLMDLQKLVSKKKARKKSPNKSLNQDSSGIITFARINRVKSAVGSKQKLNNSNKLPKRSHSAHVKLKSNSEIEFKNEALQSEALYYKKLKEQLAALKPDKTIIKIKMTQDPVFAKRYRQFSATKKFGRPLEIDENDSYVTNVTFSKKQIEKEKERIVNSFGTKYEPLVPDLKKDSYFLKQKIDNFLKSMSTYK
jgi:hypothetical protein